MNRAGRPGDRFLCVAHDFPAPADNGSSVRVAGALRILGEAAPVRLVVARRPTTTEADLAQIEAIAGVDLLDQPPHSLARSGPLLWARAVATRTPPWFIQWFDPRVLRVLRQNLPWATHVVALDDFAAHYLPHLGSGPVPRRIVDKHKVYASGAARGEQRPGIVARVRDAGLRPIIAHDERRVLSAAHAVIVTTSEEAERLHQLHGRWPDAVVPACIDPPASAWEPPDESEPTVVWLGTLDSQPNRDGLVRLLSRLRQRRQAHPDGVSFRLAVVGKGADAGLQSLAEGLDVEFLGYVDALDGVLSTSNVALVPLWSGGGVRVKTLTLLASGIPVVATPTAVEGIAVEAARHCLIADEVDGLLDATEHLLTDPARAARMGQAGRQLVQDRYAWSVWHSAFMSAVRGLDRVDSGSPPGVGEAGRTPR